MNLVIVILLVEVEVVIDVDWLLRQELHLRLIVLSKEKKVKIYKCFSFSLYFS